MLRARQKLASCAVAVTWPKLANLSKQINKQLQCLSDEPISPKVLFEKENYLHLFFLCLGILFNLTALGIH